MFSIIVAFTQELKPDLLSRIIMWVLRVPYSHVLMIFEDKDGNSKIFHSIGKGVCVDEKLEYLNTHKIVTAYQVPMRATREEFAAHVRSRVGIEYSEGQYVNQALRWIGLKWLPVKNGKGKSICSEEVAVAAPMSDLELPQDMRPDWINPKDVDLYLAKQSKVQRLEHLHKDLFKVAA